jgi:hypothetical protein
MSLPGVWPQVLDFFGTPLVIEPSQGQLSSDAGLLPVRQFDQRIGLTRTFADALDDPRDPDLTEAVWRALAELGHDARPARMRGWIRERLGIDITADHISTAKGTILRQAGRKGNRTRKKKPGPQKAAGAPAPAAVGGKGSGIPLDDILHVKQLVGRVGPEPPHILVDAFGG